jgi:hypothetical protein
MNPFSINSEKHCNIQNPSYAGEGDAGEEVALSLLVVQL